LQLYNHTQPLVLEAGTTINNISIAYHTFGTLNADKNNVIWICHALTGNSNVNEWWPNLLGPGKAFDTNTHFVICANILGSCYGTTANGLFNQGHTPTLLTIRDMVNAHILLRKHLGIASIKLLVGGSMGGYQALEWCLMEPSIIKNQFLLTTSAAESAWGIAIHAAQRLAIEADATWLQAGGGANGLKAARAFGMVTYRSYKQYHQAQANTDFNKLDDFRAASYIQYQGQKIVSRFNAQSYWALTKSMDSHNIARGRADSINQALALITQPTLIIGISSDVLCPTLEQQMLASYIPNSQLHIIDSLYGHDGFLTETEKVTTLLQSWVVYQP
jgi:homoserine O-acetyltransferase/O-succinyltransferase